MRILSLFIILFFPLLMSAQIEYRVSGKSLIDLQKEIPDEVVFKSTRIIPTHRALPIATEKVLLPQNVMNLSSYYWKELGFFCKVELKMEQRTHFPVKFRLGTVEYVDRLEGKLSY